MAMVVLLCGKTFFCVLGIFSLLLVSCNGGFENSDVEDCNSLLVEFATSSADFMLCAISNARPIRLCTSCVGDYNGVLEGHSKILEMSESDNITCRNRLMNLDRLEIIEAGYTYVTDMWRKGRCRNCFASGEREIEPSNFTKTFSEMYNENEKCWERYYNRDNDTYDPQICDACSAFYDNMTRFYESMKNRFGDGEVCMDIVDAMNVTQNKWSSVLRCGEGFVSLEVALVSATAVILSTPIIFYIAAWLFSSAAHSPISIQHRLKTRFSEKWRSRTASMISSTRH